MFFIENYNDSVDITNKSLALRHQGRLCKPTIFFGRMFSIENKGWRVSCNKELGSVAAIVKKTISSIMAQCKDRGVYITFLMNWTHGIGVLRALFFQLFYFRHMKATVFAMQVNSRIEVFHRKARVFIGPFVFIRKNASLRVDHDGELRLGQNVFINDNCVINCAHKITIGRNTKIAPNVCINDHDHNYKAEQEGHLLTGEVHIGENVWIGANAVILRGTTIGDHAVIAAGSIVKGVVPAHTVFLNKREPRIMDYGGGLRKEAL